jgi:hypothetical protein
VDKKVVRRDILSSDSSASKATFNRTNVFLTKYSYKRKIFVMKETTFTQQSFFFLFFCERRVRLKGPVLPPSGTADP